MHQESIVSNSEIGAAIRRRRQELSISLEQLGNMTNVSGQQVQRYENGIDRLNVLKLQEVAQALSVPVCYFFLHGTQKTEKLSNCHELFTLLDQVEDKETKALLIDMLRIVNRNYDKKSVPALLLSHYVRQNPILLIDDEVHVLTFLKLFLESEGFQNLHLIQDSRMVVPFMKEKMVSLIILDIKMPHIDGNDLFYTLLDNFPEIPVILLSALKEKETMVNCKKLGAFDYLVKPVSPDRLLLTIYKALHSCSSQFHEVSPSIAEC
jgi:CheY-like chemotaxis protein